MNPCDSTSAKAHGFYDGSLGYDIENYAELLRKVEGSALWFFDDNHA